MIQLNNISLAYNKRVIFDDISCVFQSGQHIGVVGANGAGKSTLLKAISGHLQLDGGSIALERDKTIAYMPQEIVLTSQKTVFDETFSALTELVNLQEEKQRLEQNINSNINIEDTLERYAQLQEKLAFYDVSSCMANAERILKGLGFNQETMQKSVNSLSVGWKMRVVLAKLLLKQADFYLFDEPTNHLDMISKEWFFNFLKTSSSGCLLVTHDKYFLDRACDFIFEMERGQGTLYIGNFSQYCTKKEESAVMQQAAYDRQQKEIERKQETIDRFRAGTKSRMAQSMIKKLEKVELLQPQPVLPKVRFTFPACAQSGSVVLEFNNLSYAFNGQTIFANSSGIITRGEKVALIAPNGMGKTTLLNLVTGIYSNHTGAIKFGHNVAHTFFQQNTAEALSDSSTILEEILNAYPNTTRATICHILGSFLFSGDDVNKKIGMLSGGERCRIALVKLLLAKANFLILDEPTNHLDIYSKEILLQALQQFEGTILIVCHDHDFIERLATRIVELTPTALYSYPGKYESYLYHKNLEQDQEIVEPRPQSTSKKSATSAKQTLSNKESFALRKELGSLEAKISKLEMRLQQLTHNFSHHQYGQSDYKETESLYAATQNEHAQVIKRWEELMALLDQTN